MAASDASGIRWYPVETIRAQIAACLSTWGMPADHVETTSMVMADADECGIDTHGIATLTTYESRIREGIVTMNPTIEVVKETALSALIDAGGGLGYVPSVLASNLAITKAKQLGMAAVSVRNSNHFGATGYYTRLIARAGLIGLATTNCSGPRMAPTFGAEAKLSTNPLAFTAPAHKHPPFNLDMATTTVASGKIRLHANEGTELPIGWANDHAGRPLRDASTFFEPGTQATLTPIGGTPAGASYKGYGLGAMVEILSAGLSGASLVTSEGHGYKTPGTMNLGHFFLALDPALFRPRGEFEETVDELIDHLHSTRPVSPGQPVLVAGEPEDKIRAERKKTGIPVPPGLRSKLREITNRYQAPFLYD